MLSHVRMLGAYNAWANERLTSWLRSKPADVLDEPGVLALLRSRYDLREDFVLLQQAVSGETPAEDFDRLRRDYRVRHEMAGVEVSGRVADSLRQLLSLLGVQA